MISLLVAVARQRAFRYVSFHVATWSLVIASTLEGVAEMSSVFALGHAGGTVSDRAQLVRVVSVAGPYCGLDGFSLQHGIEQRNGGPVKRGIYAVSFDD